MANRMIDSTAVIGWTRKYRGITDAITDKVICCPTFGDVCVADYYYPDCLANVDVKWSIQHGHRTVILDGNLSALATYSVLCHRNTKVLGEISQYDFERINKLAKICSVEFLVAKNEA